MKVNQAFQLFLKYQSAQNKPATVKSYEERLKTFLHGFGNDLYNISDVPGMVSDSGLYWLIVGHGQRELVDVTPENVDDWLLVLKSQKALFVGNIRPTTEGGLSKATIEGRKQSLKAFFRFCEDRNYVVRSPARHIRKAKVSRKNHVKDKVMSLFDFYKLLDVTMKRAKGGNSRDLAMLCLLADSGMRPGELIALDKENVRLDQMEADVIDGKTGDRTIVFSHYTAKALEDYYNFRELLLICGNGNRSKALFLGLHYPNIGRRLKRDAINSLFSRLRKEAGVTGTCNPYSIRHMVGDNLAMRAGVALPLVKDVLGHASIETTMNYIHPDLTQVKGVVALHSLLNDYFKNGA